MSEKKTEQISLFISFEPSHLADVLNEEVVVRRLSRLPWIDGLEKISGSLFFLLNQDLIESWQTPELDVFFQQLEQLGQSTPILLIAPPATLESTNNYLSLSDFYGRGSKLGLSIFNLSELLPFMKSGSFFSFSNLYSLGAGYSKEFLRLVGETINGLVRHRLGRDFKLIVLDLDETLWPGILAEDGALISDVEDPIFRASVSFQKRLKYLKAHGFLLALCSKNDSDQVDNIFKNANFPLDLNDFVRVECSWDPKHIGLQRIISDLRFSPKQVAFLENSPFEREFIKKIFPEVFVPNLSTSYFQRRAQLDEWFGSWHPFTTKQDQKRTDSYRANVIRDHLRMKVSDLEQWILSLNPKLRVQVVGVGLRDRALQLLRRTNQFNCHPENLIASDRNFENYRIFSYRDRLGDDGPIALIRFEKSPDAIRVTHFVLSCRVFGRTIEDAVLTYVQNLAQSLKIQNILFTFKQSDRNRAAQEFIMSDRFLPIVTGEFQVIAAHKTLIPIDEEDYV